MATGIIGAVLAGGRATRLGGRPKGLIAHHSGQTMLQYVAGEMEGAGLSHVVLLAGDMPAGSAQGLPVLPDLRSGLGPLAGIEAGLSYAREAVGADGVLFTPCDVPRVSASHMRRLLAAFRTRTRGICVAYAGSAQALMEPLFCVVRCNILPEVRKALDDGRLSVRRLWDELGAHPVPFADPGTFHNINTPADLDAWRRYEQATR